MKKELEIMKQALLRYVSEDFGIKYIEQHLRRYAETVKLIPTSPRLKALDLGTFIPLAGYLKDTTKHSYAYHGIWKGEKMKKIKFQRQEFLLHNFDAEKDKYPFPNGSFDLILCCEVIEHLGLDPMNMIEECNRILKQNGLLLLTTPNATSLRNVFKILLGYSPYFYPSFTLTTDRHNREYAPREIEHIFAYGGFKVKKIFTKDVYFPEGLKLKGINILMKIILTAMSLFSKFRGDCIFVIAKKVGEVKNRYPIEFYDDIDHKNI